MYSSFVISDPGLLCPDFTLHLWNLTDSDYYALCAAKNLSVCHVDSIPVSGRISDVYLRIVSEGKITEVVFATGLELREAPVSLSVEAGVSVSGFGKSTHREDRVS